MPVNPWNDKTPSPIFERAAPCDCGDCPDCSEWTNLEGDATYPILAADIGKCYNRTKNNIAITLPVAATIRDGYCVTVRNTARPSGDVYVRPAPEDTGVHFYFGEIGLTYDYITINFNGEACICFDGLNFHVTGDASGWNGT
jgi:hypothetical protein